LPVILGEGVAVSADVQEREAGLVVQPDAGAIARAMMELLGDPELRSRCGNNGRRLVHDQFSLEAMGQALVSLYEKVRTQWEAREGCAGN
jgi:glycosyltransferase involved in cell wall biosynthesis